MVEIGAGGGSVAAPSLWRSRFW